MSLPTGVVTYLFTDIEGSTRMVQRLGDAFDAVLAEHNQMMRAAIAAHDGVEVKTEGDSFFVVFASPLACARAMIEMQRSLARHPWPEGGRVQVRMGAHTAEARLGGDDYIGVEVNRAARLGAIGHGGQMLVSAATSALLGDRIADEAEVRDLGAHRLKDFDEPLSVHQLIVPDLPVDFPPLRSADIPNNLPTPGSEFVGREAEAKAVSDLLAANRLVTLTGPGGTGKTRLAIQVAADVMDRHPGGVWFVALDALRDPDHVLGAIAEAIGAPNPDEVETTLKDMGTALLIVDNMEHVMAAVPELAGLLEACPELTMLCTSQALLRLRGEQAYPVPLLGLPASDDAEGVERSDSGELFLRRVWARDPGFELDDASAPTVAGIVRSLEGLPLAIELAAARVRLFGLEGLRHELDDRLGTLAGGYADAPERHQTLASAIEWSYDLLSEEEQEVLCGASVFVGGFTLASAGAVCDVPGLLPAIESLVDKSLLRSEITGGTARFRMLDSIRAFAAQRLADAGDAAAVERAHAEYFSEVAARAEGLRSEGGYALLEKLSIERANITAALRWCVREDPDHGLHTLESLARFFEMVGGLGEGREIADELLAADGVSAEARLAGLMGSASMVYWLMDYADAAARYEEAARIAEELGDQGRLGHALVGLAYSYIWSERLDDAAAPLDRAQRVLEAIDDEAGVRMTLTARSSKAWLERDISGAALTFIDLHRINQDLGDAAETLAMELALAGTLLHFGEEDRSIGVMLDVLDRAVASGDDGRATMALDYLSIPMSRRHPPDGARLTAAVEEIAKKGGGTFNVAALGLGDPREITAEALPGPERYRLWAEGGRMNLEAAVALARDWAEANGLQAERVDPDEVRAVVDRQ